MRRFGGVRAWSTAMVFGGASACTVPAYVGDDTAVPVEDTDTTVTDSAPEDTPVDTPPEETEPPRETGWPDDQDTTGGGGGGGGGGALSPIGCHPFQPIEGVGWRLVFDAQYGTARNGREVWEGQGLVTLPAWLDVNGFTDAYAWSTVITNAGAADSENVYYGRCDLDGVGLFDLGWERAIQAGLLGRTTITLRADARQERKVLPGESELLGGYPFWQQNMRYDLTQTGGTIGGASAAELVNNATYTSAGVEAITTPAGTFTDAQHIIVVYTEEKQDSGGGGLMDLFFAPFEALFQAILGFSEGTASVTAQSDRWYVRGIGLVKEVTFDTNTGDTISSKSLRSCSGLPDCP
jgi:hypothetical protein